MKTWNRKIFRRVVLILLTVSMVCGSLGGCKQMKSAETWDAARPWLKLEWEDREYSIDQVTVSLSIGIFLNRESTAKLPYMPLNVDSFYGAALYFCSADSLHWESSDYADFPTLKDHKLIREIPVEEVLSSKYVMKRGFFGRKFFRHAEQITIPKEVLTEYKDSFYIKLVLVGIKDGQILRATGTMSIGLLYKFTDENHIRFTSAAFPG